MLNPIFAAELLLMDEESSRAVQISEYGACRDDGGVGFLEEFSVTSGDKMNNIYQRN